MLDKAQIFSVALTVAALAGSLDFSTTAIKKCHLNKMVLLWIKQRNFG